MKCKLLLSLAASLLFTHTAFADNAAVANVEVDASAVYFNALSLDRASCSWQFDNISFNQSNQLTCDWHPDTSNAVGPQPIVVAIVQVIENNSDFACNVQLIEPSPLIATQKNTSCKIELTSKATESLTEASICTQIDRYEIFSPSGQWGGAHIAEQCGGFVRFYGVPTIAPIQYEDGGYYESNGRRFTRVGGNNAIPDPTPTLGELLASAGNNFGGGFLHQSCFWQNIGGSHQSYGVEISILLCGEGASTQSVATTTNNSSSCNISLNNSSQYTIDGASCSNFSINRKLP